MSHRPRQERLRTFAGALTFQGAFFGFPKMFSSNLDEHSSDLNEAYSSDSDRKSFFLVADLIERRETVKTT